MIEQLYPGMSGSTLNKIVYTDHLPAHNWDVCKARRKITTGWQCTRPKGHTGGHERKLLAAGQFAVCSWYSDVEQINE